MEVKVIQAETCSFAQEWPQDFTVVPDDTQYVISVDPAPFDIEKTPSDVTEEQDWLVVSVVGFHKEDVFLETQHSARNENPDQTVNWIFEFSRRYGTRTVIIEVVAYQKTLAWLVDKEAEKRKHYLIIEQFKDKRSKYDRITQAILLIGPYGHLYVRASCSQFLTEYGAYGVGYRGHDDHLDSFSIAVAWMKRLLRSDEAIEAEYRRLRDEDDGRFLEDKEKKTEEGFQSCP
jgi:hypothetical protein